MTTHGSPLLPTTLGRLLLGSALLAATAAPAVPAFADNATESGAGGVHVRGPRPVPAPDPFAAPDVHLATPRLRAHGSWIDVALPVHFVNTARRSAYEVQITVHDRLAANGAPRGIAERIVRAGKVAKATTTLHVRIPRDISRHLRSQGLRVPVKGRTSHQDPARLVQVVVRQTIKASGGRPRQMLSDGSDVSRPAVPVKPKSSGFSESVTRQSVPPTHTPPSRVAAHVADIGAKHRGRGHVARAADTSGGNNAVFTGDDPNYPTFVGQNIPVKVTVSSGTGDRLQVTTFPVGCMVDEAVTGLTTTFDSASQSASGTATVLGGNPHNTGTLDLPGLADAYNSWLATEEDGSNNLAVLGGLSPSVSQFYFGKQFAFSSMTGTLLQQMLDTPGTQITAPSNSSNSAPTITNGSECGNQVVVNVDSYSEGVSRQIGSRDGHTWFSYYQYNWCCGFDGTTGSDGYSTDGIQGTYVEPAYFFIQVTDIEPTSAAGTSFLSGLISIQPADQWQIISGSAGNGGWANLYQPEIYAQFIPIAASNPGGGGSYACATVTIPSSLKNGAVGVGIQYNLDQGDPTTETTDNAGSTCQAS